MKNITTGTNAVVQGIDKLRFFNAREEGLRLPDRQEFIFLRNRQRLRRKMQF